MNQSIFYKIFFFSLLFFIFNITCLFSQLYFKIEGESVAGNGENTPLWILSNKHGISSIEPDNSYLRAGLFKSIDDKQKLNYGFGFDAVETENYTYKFILQQAYFDVKYKKSLFTIGSKEYNSMLKNSELSSGGLTWSGNARPIPQIRWSLHDFTTFSWLFRNKLKVKGDVSFGWFSDGDFQEKKVNLQVGGEAFNFRNTDVRYHHKSVVLEYDLPQKPWTFTFGLETEVQFGGNKYFMKNDTLMSQQSPVDFYHYLMVLVPLPGDSKTAKGDVNYVYGNSLGSMHLMTTYHTQNFDLKGYLENYFDDFSGLIKQNGFDGLWGLEYMSKNKVGITGVVFEYLQTTNQSGPVLWWQKDHPGTNLTYLAKGNDDYYNNYFYTGWENWGMANGSPLITSPIYNKTGSLRFENNRVKAYHLGISGTFDSQWSGRVLLTSNNGWGRYYVPYTEVKSSLSALLEINYSPRKCKGLAFTASGALDRGTLYGDNSAFALKISKKGFITK